jgi:hypothetical protein
VDLRSPASFYLPLNGAAPGECGAVSGEPSTAGPQSGCPSKAPVKFRRGAACVECVPTSPPPPLAAVAGRWTVGAAEEKSSSAIADCCPRLVCFWVSVGSLVYLFLCGSMLVLVDMCSAFN